MEIEQLKVYMCRIKIRPEYKGMIAKPEIEKMNGELVHLQAWWLQDEDDKYPGEWAMGSEDGVNNQLPIWISSGDLDILPERIEMTTK